MSVDGSYLIPFTGFEESPTATQFMVDGGIPVNFTRTGVHTLLAKDAMYGQRQILMAADELITKLAQILNRIQVRNIFFRSIKQSVRKLTPF